MTQVRSRGVEQDHALPRGRPPVRSPPHARTQRAAVGRDGGPIGGGSGLVDGTPAGAAFLCGVRMEEVRAGGTDSARQILLAIGIGSEPTTELH